MLDLPTRAGGLGEPDARHPINEGARRWSVDPSVIENVLLLEPDETTAAQIAAELRELGVHLTLETEPFHAIARIGMGGIQLMIASAHLGRTQLETLVTVVRQEMALPVLIAHGAGDTDAIGPAVVAGAQPIISLPYKAQDVVRVLRSSMPASQPRKLIEVGDLRILPDSHVVRFAGDAVDLSPLELELLIMLAAPGSPAIARRALARQLWPDADPDHADAVLGAAVARVRRKFRSLGIEDVVHTVRGVGYRLNEDLLHRGPVAEPSAL